MSSLKYSLMCGATAVVAFGAFSVGTMSTAEAGGFALREQSSIGQGSSFAGVAAGGSLSSMYWNPATLTQMQGTNTESVFTGVIPDTEIKNITTTNVATTDHPGNVGLAGFIPGSYSGLQVTDDLFVGLSVNAPFGLATKANNPSSTGFHSLTAQIFTTDVKANIAYRINDAFSVGASLGVVYGKVRMTSAPNANAGAPPFVQSGHELKGDAWAPSFSLGATFKPFEGTTIGIGYRSGIKLDLEGTETLALTATTNDITATLDLPGMVTVGLRQDLTEQLRLLATAEWTNWSTVKDPIPINNSISGSSTLHLGYKDSWFVSVGGEYDYSDALTLRAGVGYEKSPIPTEHRNLRLPDANRIWASVGASYQWNEELGVDVGYTRLFVDDAVVTATRAGQSYTADTSSSVDIISASMRYKWKAEPMFAGDEPIVRKY